MPQFTFSLTQYSQRILTSISLQFESVKFNKTVHGLVSLKLKTVHRHLNAKKDISIESEQNRHRKTVNISSKLRYSHRDTEDDISMSEN